MAGEENALSKDYSDWFLDKAGNEISMIPSAIEGMIKKGIEYSGGLKYTIIMKNGELSILESN